jgi:hypothetical protein
MLCSFNETQEFRKMDQSSFKFSHKLLGHPALGLDNLANVLPGLKDRVLYSKDLLSVTDDFESTFKENSKERSIEEVIETMHTSNSYIMVNGPEADSSFKNLHLELVEDVNVLMQRIGVGKKALDPKLFLFIASPNSVTPFHIDRYSTFLMQFRGSKQVSVFPQWGEQVVSSVNREAYITYANTNLPFDAQVDSLGNCFDFSPGDALHIPFIAGHHVKNGPEDVSISMSIIFNTEQSVAWRKALRFNYAARKLLSPIGQEPHAVGQSSFRDTLKAKAWGAFSNMRGR